MSTSSHDENHQIALQASDPRLAAAVFEQMSDAVLAVNSQGIILTCNSAAAELVALPPEEVVGKPYGTVFIEREELDPLSDLIFQHVEEVLLRAEATYIGSQGICHLHQYPILKMM